MASLLLLVPILYKEIDYFVINFVSFLYNCPVFLTLYICFILYNDNCPCF